MKRITSVEHETSFPQHVIDAMMKALESTTQKMLALRASDEERARGLTTITSVRPYRAKITHTEHMTRYTRESTDL